MSHNIIEIREKLETVCETYGKRLTELETFGWFRKPMNDLHAGLIGILIKLAFGGGLLYILYHFSSEINRMVLK
jgi:hypothetical protein